jgi:hypothetical protein
MKRLYHLELPQYSQFYGHFYQLSTLRLKRNMKRFKATIRHGPGVPLLPSLAWGGRQR